MFPLLHETMSSVVSTASGGGFEVIWDCGDGARGRNIMKTEDDPMQKEVSLG